MDVDPIDVKENLMLVIDKLAVNRVDTLDMQLGVLNMAVLASWYVDLASGGRFLNEYLMYFGWKI